MFSHRDSEFLETVLAMRLVFLKHVDFLLPIIIEYLAVHFSYLLMSLLKNWFLGVLQINILAVFHSLIRFMRTRILNSARVSLIRSSAFGLITKQAFILVVKSNSAGRLMIHSPGLFKRHIEHIEKALQYLWFTVRDGFDDFFSVSLQSERHQ